MIRDGRTEEPGRSRALLTARHLFTANFEALESRQPAKTATRPLSAGATRVSCGASLGGDGAGDMLPLGVRVRRF